MDVVESPATTGSEVRSPQTAYPGQKRKRANSFTDQPTREYGYMRDVGGRNATRFVGSGSGIHFVRNVYIRLARKSATRTPQGQGANDLVPGEDDQLQQNAASCGEREPYLWRSNEVTPANEDNTRPSFEQLVDWSKSYFESWHPVYPFLYAPDILCLFETISESGFDSLGSLDQAVIKTIISISLADSRQGTRLLSPIPRCLLFSTVEDAMSRAQFALSQPASIQASQAALSIQLFLLSFLRLNSASRLGGLIVRMAFHLGLHRCPSRFPFFTEKEAQIRRRIFWCVYCMDRYLCQSLGLPLDIRDDDVDVCFPGEETHGSPSAAVDERLELLGYVAKHARIRGLILELRNKSIANRHDTADRATYVQAELARWSNEIQDAVEDGTQPPRDRHVDEGSPPSISRNHCVFLLLLKYESLISLNRPVMTSDASGSSYSAALQNCISAAKSIFVTLKRYRFPNEFLGSSSGTTAPSPILWPSFTWSIWISTFILIYATFEQQLPASSALRHVESGKSILRDIATRGTSWPRYCLSAIEELTDAVGDMSRHPFTQGHTLDNEPSFSGARRTKVDNTSSGSSAGRMSQEISESTRFTQRSNGLPDSLAASRAADENTGAIDNTWDDFQMPGQLGTLGMPKVDSIQNRQTTSLATLPDTNANQYEGQESLLWYDQLFDNTFSALESPFLAAAQFDRSVDPTWSYLR